MSDRDLLAYLPSIGITSIQHHTQYFYVGSGGQTHVFEADTLLSELILSQFLFHYFLFIYFLNRVFLTV